MKRSLPTTYPHSFVKQHHRVLVTTNSQQGRDQSSLQLSVRLFKCVQVVSNELVERDWLFFSNLGYRVCNIGVEVFKKLDDTLG